MKAALGWRASSRASCGAAVPAAFPCTSAGTAAPQVWRRIVENPGTARDLYFSSAWQVLEERVGSAVKSQQVWSPVYVDALVERDRDADGSAGNGLEERLYVQQDANFNVTGLINTSGTVQERYAYDPYGKPTILNSSWTTLASSAFAWQYLHQRGRYDTTTALYYFRNRDLSPALGRWIEVDPIGFEGGDLNLYGYVEATPLGSVDPQGLQKKRPKFGIDPNETLGGTNIRPRPNPKDPPRPTGEFDAGACVKNCLMHLIGMGLDAGVVGSGLPTRPKPFVTPGTSPGTSYASEFLSAKLPCKLPFKVPIPTIGNRKAASRILGRVLGRAVPYVGWGLLALDSFLFVRCLLNCNEQSPSPGGAPTDGGFMPPWSG